MVTTREPGAYLAINGHMYRGGLFEDFAVQYVRINRVVKKNAERNNKSTMQEQL